MTTNPVCTANGFCPAEQGFDGVNSPSKVADNEQVCRAGFEPLHIQDSHLTAAFIRSADIEQGAISIWRKSYLPDQSPQGLEEHFKALGPKSEKQVYRATFAPTAGALRALQHATHGRFLCVIDNTEDAAPSSTGERSHHQAHAAIRVCESFPLTENKQWVRQQLLTVFENNILVA